MSTAEKRHFSPTLLQLNRGITAHICCFNSIVTIFSIAHPLHDTLQTSFALQKQQTRLFFSHLDDGEISGHRLRIRHQPVAFRLARFITIQLHALHFPVLGEHQLCAATNDIQLTPRKSQHTNGYITPIPDTDILEGFHETPWEPLFPRNHIGTKCSIVPYTCLKK